MSPDKLLLILETILGIGLVIFVHELGHFLAARWCKVRVEVFSLGFGPALLAWRRGDTLYQIAAVPLGGYVKMAGEDALAGDRPPASDELPGKSIGQRFFIYSGGVLMNIAFGVVVFPMLFAIGVPLHQPLITPAPAGPAWQAGLQAGTRVLSIDGEEVWEFIHLPQHVAFGDGDAVALEILDPGSSEPRTVHVKPEIDKRNGMRTIGVGLAADPLGLLVVSEDSPATRAGLAAGARLLSVHGALPGLPLSTQLLWAMQSGDPIEVEVEQDGTRRTLTIEAEPSEESAARLGIIPPQNVVVGLRPSPLEVELGLRLEDRLVAVAGVPIRRRGDLRRVLLDNAGSALALALSVRRDGVLRELRLGPLSREQALALTSAVALGVDEASTEVVVTPGEAAAAAGLRDGDRLLRIGDNAVPDWAGVKDAIRAAARAGESVRLALERAVPSGPAEQLEFEATPAPVAWPHYGITPMGAQYVFRTQGPLEAVQVGLTSSWRMLKSIWLSLQGLILGQIPAKEGLGGPILIGTVSYRFAQEGVVKLLFFLCMLSMNLGLLNALPVPLLDGGHLFFLLIEKVRGSPVPERVLNYSQMVGLVLLVSLVVYVTYNDIMRFVTKG